MAEERMSDGEIRRTFDRIERDVRSVGDRLTQTAREMVPSTLWAAEHQAALDRITRAEQQQAVESARLEKAQESSARALGEDVEDLRGEVKSLRTQHEADIKALRTERESRAQFTWQKAIGLVAALAAVATVVVTLLTSSRGH